MKIHEAIITVGVLIVFALGFLNGIKTSIQKHEAKNQQQFQSVVDVTRRCISQLNEVIDMCESKVGNSK